MASLKKKIKEFDDFLIRGKILIMNQKLFNDIKIIFENEDFLALNKPAGLLVHPVGRKNTEKTLVDWLKEKYPAIKKLFQEHKIRKGYLALVFGNFKNKIGTIDKPIGIKSSSIKRSTAARKMREMKSAETDYKVIRNFKSDKSPGFAFLEVFPKTGRTNQIRVHLASIGHPVVGDKVYGSKKLFLPHGLNRMFLHAYFLEFPLKEGRVIRLEADLAEDLKDVLAKLDQNI